MPRRVEFRFRPSGKPGSGQFDQPYNIYRVHGQPLSSTRWLSSGQFWWGSNASFLLTMASDLVCVSKNITDMIDYHPMTDHRGRTISYLDKHSEWPTITLVKDKMFQDFNEFVHKPDPFKDEIEMVWREGSRAKTRRGKTRFFLDANQPGLLSIVCHLVSLAQEDVPDCTSIMWDEDSGLEKGSIPLTFQKREKLPPGGEQSGPPIG